MKLSEGMLKKKSDEIDCLWCKACTCVGEVPELRICAMTDEELFYREGVYPMTVAPSEHCPECR